MAMADSVGAEDGRLSVRAASALEPKFQDALAHPVRREVLRALNQHGRSRSATEIAVELRAFHPCQLSYHLQVLRRLGVIISEHAGIDEGQRQARYSSKVCDDRQVRGILRATEQWDREHREAAAAANASPLLTMFRVPRPVRTIRLRSRRETDAERDR